VLQAMTTMTARFFHRLLSAADIMRVLLAYQKQKVFAESSARFYRKSGVNL
jgi:hypothetical protein